MKNEKRYEVDVHGHRIIVYDLLSSQSVHYLDQDFIDRNPFELVKDPNVILDIGAHVGMFSFTAAKKWPNAKIYSVEPHQTNIKNFILGLEENRLTNVQLIPAAVGHKGWAELMLELGNSGSGSSYPKAFRMFGEHWPMIHCRSVTMSLNHIVTLVGEHIDYLKMDIEGAEFDALDRFSYWDQVGAMWLELHPFSLVDDQPSAEQLCKDTVAFVQRRMPDKPVHVVYPDFTKEIEFKEKFVAGQ